MKPFMQFTIPICPTSKKNSQQIFMVWRKGGKSKRPIIVPSAKYKKYEKDCEEYLSNLPYKLLDFPLNVKALYFRKTLHVVDLPNLNEALHDTLVKYKVLKNDSALGKNGGRIVVATDGSRVYYDSENPRTEVFISKMPEVY